MKKTIVFFGLFCICILTIQAGGAQSAASSTRGVYLAREGVIVPPEEVYVDSYIASVDYRYPDPTGAIGITFRSGNRQISTGGQEEVIHVGIQAKRSAFAELPPLNLSFIIDKSGSMAEENKMSWVKDAFDIFIESVRDVDFVSLVVFNNAADVIFPSTRMKSRQERERFQRAVQRVEPGGGTNLSAGLQLGYQEVLANFRKEYTNRVLFLTDGVGESEGILEMAEQFESMGINVSTIGVGTGFDHDLMVELGRRGGGSSRFISDREEMEDIFGDEFSRMVVPAARNLQMTLSFPDGVEILDTWGYNYRFDAGAIHYSQKTLHLGDYETILVSIRYPSGMTPGRRTVAAFEITYEDLEGTVRDGALHVLEAEFVNRDYPVAGFSDGIVLQSGTMLHFAQNLRRIGELYYNRNARGPVGGDARSRLRQAFDLTVDTRKELRNVRARLDNLGFDDEIEILEQYAGILGDELNMEQGTVQRVSRDDEIAPRAATRSFQEHVEGLFAEMTLSLREAEPGVIAVSGFATSDGTTSGLTSYLNEMAILELAKYGGTRIVERARMAEVIEEQKLSLFDLVDTSTAVEIGQLLAANHIITGSVIEMASSVVIFARIIDLESGEVESAAQIIVQRDSEVEALLETRG